MHVPEPVRRVVLLGLAAISLGVAAFFLTLPDVRELASGWPERTAYMRSWLEDEAEDAAIDYRPVALSRIPVHVRRAVLVSEDAAFYEHGGFDWHEIRTAIREAWVEREAPRGASTITQQLARNLYLSASRNPVRKLREAVITRRLERALSKDRILELYLNVIELGPGVYGVEAAARRYFGTSIDGVSRRQAAQLAGTIPSPRRNNPATQTRSFQFRTGLAYERAFGTSGGEAGQAATGADATDAPRPQEAPGDSGAAPAGPGVADPAGLVPDSTEAVPDSTDVARDSTGPPSDSTGVPPDSGGSPPDTALRKRPMPAPTGASGPEPPAPRWSVRSPAGYR